MRLYSEEHQWIEMQEDKTVLVGISSFMADELGDVQFVELPEPESIVTQGDALCVVESTKTASDVPAPVSGKVCEVNSKLVDHPELMSASPEKAGWICKLVDVDEGEFDSLMNDSDYEVFVAD
jgi:glycine cleavage system H protein